MFAISNEELNNARELNETEPCPKCGKLLKVKQSVPAIMSYVNCPECGTYLVGVKGKRVNMIKPERKEKVVPKKYDRIKRRCDKFWCAIAKANICCRFCPLVARCETKCYNKIIKCNCVTDEIIGKDRISTVGECEK